MREPDRSYAYQCFDPGVDNVSGIVGRGASQQARVVQISTSFVVNYWSEANLQTPCPPEVQWVHASQNPQVQHRGSNKSGAWRGAVGNMPCK